MSKPTDAVERAKRDNDAIQFLDDHRYVLDDAYRAVMNERDDAEREVENLKVQLAGTRCADGVSQIQILSYGRQSPSRRCGTAE